LLLLLFCCIDVLVIAAAVVAAAVIVAVVFLDCSPSGFNFSSLFPCHHLYLHSSIHSFISHP
jgi:hypothetical protein